jgi:hypothetical protein
MGLKTKIPALVAAMLVLTIVASAFAGTAAAQPDNDNDWIDDKNYGQEVTQIAVNYADTGDDDDGGSLVDTGDTVTQTNVQTGVAIDLSDDDVFDGL